jgi:hypothetical protein
MQKQSSVRRWIFWLFCAVFAATAYGQAVATTTGAAAATTPASAPPLPWQLSLIPIFTPLIIQAVKMFVPKIPTLWLPVMAPFLGALLDVISHYSTGSNISIGTAAALGLAGVGVREVVDQIQKVSPAGPSVPTVATVPIQTSPPATAVKIVPLATVVETPAVTTPGPTVTPA